MTSNSSNHDHQRKPEEILDEDPQSHRGDEGEAVKGGRQVGPNSDRGGEPLAPQTGDPRAKDRRSN